MTPGSLIRNRITGDEGVIVEAANPAYFGFIGVQWDDDERTFYIAPDRLEVIEQLTECRGDPLRRAA